MRRRRTIGTRFAVPLGLAAAILTTAVPAPAAAPDATAAPITLVTSVTSVTSPTGSAADAQTRAMRARARVDALVDEYTEAERAVAQGLSRVSAAYAVADSASVDADRVERVREEAAAQRVRDIRAVYTSGGTAWLTATLLEAGSPSELLWRQSTNSQVMSGLLNSDERVVRSAEADARLAAYRAADADDAAQEQASAMGELRVQSETARLALRDARRTLSRLDRSAKRARAAQDARAAIAAAERRARADRHTATGNVTALGIPAEYEAAYRAAAGTCPDLRWTLLAAVGQVESGHGRNVGPSSAGAQGPMQFMPGTFAVYGVDGDHDGAKDIQDPQDAIFSAARYLCASGLRDATKNSAARVRAALYAYNRADWYVDLVLSAERAIVARSAESPS